jgi:hypothetical protein
MAQKSINFARYQQTSLGATVNKAGIWLLMTVQ